MQEFHAGAPTPAPLVLESDHQSSAEVRECHLLGMYSCIDALVALTLVLSFLFSLGILLLQSYFEHGCFPRTRIWR